MLRKNLESHTSFAFETTMSGKWLISFLKQARNKRYKIVCFFIFVYPMEMLKYRIEERIKKGGGHFIDFKTVKRRYGKSIRNFWWLYKNFCDEWEIIDNTEGFKPIATGIKETYEVEDEYIFEKFLKLVEADI